MINKKNYEKISIKKHKKYGSKIEMVPKVPLKNKDDLSTFYTPGIAGPCLEIKKNHKKARDLTINGKCVAVISDGSAVLGLGNIGPLASLPVMEGKALLFKKLGGVNAFPIVVNTQNVDEFVQTVKNIAPSFGGINIEDVSAPRCFEIEDRLKKELNIPVIHDDQHATAIVTLAGLINSLKIVKKKKEVVKVVINGVGAAGISIIKLLSKYGFKNIISCDSSGIISKNRDNLNKQKKEILKFTNLENIQGNLLDAIHESDIFIGVSVGNVLKKEHIKSMNDEPIIFALANPIPEILPEIAKKYGAKIVATGSSKYPNQINNVLVFPGMFKGCFENNVKEITDEIKIRCANAIASIVKKPTISKIIPTVFNKKVVPSVAKSIKNKKFF
jgi:malate dehydrogenase (oxaloacetate-decarboxylating)